jgi:hypothetical protein
MSELCPNGICPVCQKLIDKKVNWERILDEGYSELWMVGDMDLPQEALPENVQVLYHNCVHVDCYYNLD